MFHSEKQGAVDVITCRAAINAESVDKLSEVVEQGLQQGQPMTVLDMCDTPLLDSAGLETLLAFQDRFEQRGGAIKLTSLTPLCEDILAATGVGDRFEQYYDLNSAVRSFLR